MNNMKHADAFRKTTRNFAEEVIKMEEAGDYSMRGVWLRHVIDNYVSIKGVEFCSMFDFIWNNQSEVHGSYGDIDTTVVKVGVKNIKPKYDDYSIEATALYVRDNPGCSGAWYIVRVVSAPMNEMSSYMRTVSYHIRKTRDEEAKPKIDFKKICQYGDLRDDGYVASFESGYNNRPVELIDLGRGVNFERFVDAMNEVRQAYKGLQMDLEELTQPTE